MSQTKKPRKKAYKPKYSDQPICPMTLVLNKLIPAREIDTINTAKIRCAAIMSEINAGRADRQQFNKIIDASNLVEMLCNMGFGDEHKEIAIRAREALMNIVERAHRIKRFGMNDDERSALNAMLQLHDAQLNVVNCGELKKAVDTVQRRLENGQSLRLKTPVIEVTA